MKRVLVIYRFKDWIKSAHNDLVNLGIICNSEIIRGKSYDISNISYYFPVESVKKLVLDEEQAILEEIKNLK